MNGSSDVATAGFVSRSHKAIAPFALERAESVAAAAASVANGAVPHAGGIDVVERMQGGAAVERVVDVSGLADLRQIVVVGDVLRIGAAVTHARIESDATIAGHCPALAAAWATVGNVRIRRTGTIGGNLMAFDKDYDAAPILAAVGATLVFAAPDGEFRRSVADRVPGALLVAVEIATGAEVRFDRSLKPAVTVAVGAAAGRTTVAVGCAHPGVQVVDAEQLDDLPEPIDDADASSAYRRRMISVLAERLIETST
ncbi:MAG: FAD binding domain-containing protein [Actinomycetota bacterium]